MIAMPRTTIWEFGGWRWFRVLPFLFVLAPISEVLGLAFEAWACGGHHAHKALHFSVARMAAVGAACGVHTLLQMNLAFEKFAESGSESPIAVGIAGTAVFVLLLGLWQLLVEMLPRAPPPEAFDSNIFFERRTQALARQPWFEGGRLRPEVWSIILLYTFWGGVWGLKLLLNGMVILPALYNAHAAIDRAQPKCESCPWVQPAVLLRMVLLTGVWLVGIATFIADSLLWCDSYAKVPTTSRAYLDHASRMACAHVAHTSRIPRPHLYA